MCMLKPQTHTQTCSSSSTHDAVVSPRAVRCRRSRRSTVPSRRSTALSRQCRSPLAAWPLAMAAATHAAPPPAEEDEDENEEEVRARRRPESGDPAALCTRRALLAAASPAATLVSAASAAVAWRARPTAFSERRPLQQTGKHTHTRARAIQRIVKSCAITRVHTQRATHATHRVYRVTHAQAHEPSKRRGSAYKSAKIDRRRRRQ